MTSPAVFSTSETDSLRVLSALVMIVLLAEYLLFSERIVKDNSMTLSRY